VLFLFVLLVSCWVLHCSSLIILILCHCGIVRMGTRILRAHTSLVGTGNGNVIDCCSLARLDDATTNLHSQKEQICSAMRYKCFLLYVHTKSSLHSSLSPPLSPLPLSLSTSSPHLPPSSLLLYKLKILMFLYIYFIYFLLLYYILFYYYTSSKELKYKM
jgi:hypothetical protein